MNTDEKDLVIFELCHDIMATDDIQEIRKIAMQIVQFCLHETKPKVKNIKMSESYNNLLRRLGIPAVSQKEESN